MPTSQSSQEIQSDIISSSPPVAPQYSIAKDRPRRDIRPPQKYAEANLVAYALNEKMESLHENVIWDLMRFPKANKVIRCKWVFKNKEGLSRAEDARYKARLVAKDYSQFRQNRDGVIEYVDSDFTGDLDKRRSLTGYVFSFSSCTISWKATLHTTVSLSTTEGEYMVIIEAFKEAIWLKGLFDGARGVFGRMRRKNVISWTSMISAYAIHGEADQALMLFRQMKEPNWITFVVVLYACSHAGLVDEAQQIFSSMRSPSNIVIWGSLMATCRIHGEFELGEFAAKRLLELDPEHDGAYVFLSNVYTKGKRWENVGEVRQLMKHKGIWKERGHGKIEMDNEIHEFLTADKSDKHADDIYGKLAEVVCKLKQVGYAPNTSVVLIDVGEDEKKDMVLLHSEKLALCYGLPRSNNGSPTRIIKNLRICEDCHNFMKLASKVFEREIVVRDRTRFHHYRDGSCSCVLVKTTGENNL
ncbi:hypothetical protein BC332_29532 [Capsicum chinense]|nr:hypothetical protein BC332_29532 [Capsicum chinense]